MTDDLLVDIAHSLEKLVEIKALQTKILIDINKDDLENLAEIYRMQLDRITGGGNA